MVKDKNVGPLVQTDMTRCIHCTRCVRFLEEIAGTCEMGGYGPGRPHWRSAPASRTSIDSELSGNIIDLCPVGALTNKPFRYSARAWELVVPAVPRPARRARFRGVTTTRAAAGSCAAVPRDLESVNEAWLSDRDRYSHFGLYHSEDRLRTQPARSRSRWRVASR